MLDSDLGLVPKPPPKTKVEAGPKSIHLDDATWEKLPLVARANGYANRNAMIAAVLRQIVAEWEEAQHSESEQ